MRRIEFITGCLLWIAAAALMPMALEPVQAAHGATSVAGAVR